MTCPLCQYNFDDKGACHGCGLTDGCTMIKCPNCGYEFVERSVIADFLMKLFRRFRKRKEKHPQ